MKKFNFAELDKKLNIKRQLVEEAEATSNFLKFYDDLPADPQLEDFVQSVQDEFDMKSRNHRHYSYELKKEDGMAREAEKLRIEPVKKLLNFVRDFRRIPGASSSQECAQDLKEKQRKQDLRRKFQKNVRIVVQKLKALNMTAADVVELGILDRRPYKFGTSIFAAVKQGDLKTVQAIVSANKLAVFSVDNTLKNALMWACIRDYPEVADFLMEAGSNPSAQDLTGRDALYYAVKYNNPECIKSLMLRLIAVESRHEEMVTSASQKTRNVINLSMKLMNSIENLDMRKRRELFEEEYKYLYR